jgi:hypothetical protein
MNGMNLWCALAGSVLSVTVLIGGCSSGSSDEPAGQAGRSGSSAGGGAQAGAGQAGSGPTAGNAGVAGVAGVAAGGSQSAGAGGTANEAGSPWAGEGGSAGETPSGPYRAVLGDLCPVEATIGVVELSTMPSLAVQVALYDRLDPWLTPAELSTTTCAFHRYEPGGCSGCDPGELCSNQGQCVPEPRTIKDATLQVSSGSEQRQYFADPERGGIYSTLDLGDASSSYAMTLSWGETQVTLEAMPIGSGELEELSIVTETGEYDMPGALDATWQPPGDGAFVRSRIPINHHAGGPTFTECRAPTSAGAFHAEADMINPLSVQTGLEFQGVDHVFIAAARTPQGCVEFRFGTRIYAFPN